MITTIQDIREALSQQRFDEAAALRDSLPEEARASAEVRVLTARILIGQGHDAAADALLRSMGDGGDRRKVVLQLRSQVEERQKRFADLLETLESLVPLDADNARLHMRLAQARFVTGALDAALDTNCTAESLGAPEAEYLRQRVRILRRMDAPEALAQTCERLAVIEPGEIAHLRTLAPLLLRLGRSEKALEVARRLVDAWPASALAYETAFSVAADTGVPEFAAEIVEAAVAAADMAPRFAKLVLMHLVLPKERVARLVDLLCDRWPETFEPEFGRVAPANDPEQEIVGSALKDKACALAAAADFVAGLEGKPVPQNIALMPAVIAALPVPGALRRLLIVDDGSGMLVSPPGDTGLTVVAFGGVGFRLMYNFDVIDSLCAHHGASAIYCRDPSLNLFLSGLPGLGSRQATLDVLRATLEELGTTRLVVLTHSGGGMGGVALTLPLDPARYIMSAPQTVISVAAVAGQGLSPALLEVARRFEANYSPVDLDLAKQFATHSTPCDICISYGAENPHDTAQARRLVGLPGVRLLPIEGWAGHGTIAPLIASGELERLLFQ